MRSHIVRELTYSHFTVEPNPDLHLSFDAFPSLLHLEALAVHDIPATLQ